jgi:ubiquinone/menaquinone biosynthesis C-methylase UbiE
LVALVAVVSIVAVGVAAGMWRSVGAEGHRLEEVLEIAPGAVIADVGAGNGEWTLEMARRVGPAGRVFATEIDRERLGQLRKAVEEAGLTNVEIVEGAVDDANLPAGCCDAIFLRHVYHHITHPAEMANSLRSALRPGGRIAVIDFESPLSMLPIPGGVPKNRGGHGMPIEILIDEMTGEGFTLSRRIDDWFRFDYCVVFEVGGAEEG